MRDKERRTTTTRGAANADAAEGRVGEDEGVIYGSFEENDTPARVTALKKEESASLGGVQTNAVQVCI